MDEVKYLGYFFVVDALFVLVKVKVEVIMFRLVISTCYYFDSTFTIAIWSIKSFFEFLSGTLLILH